MNAQDQELRHLVMSIIPLINKLFEHQLLLFKFIQISSPSPSEPMKNQLQALQQVLEDAIILLRKQSKKLPPS